MWIDPSAEDLDAGLAKPTSESASSI